MRDIKELANNLFSDINPQSRVFIFIPSFLGLGLFAYQYRHMFYAIKQTIGYCDLISQNRDKEFAALSAVFNHKSIHRSKDQLWYTMIDKDKNFKQRAGIYCFDYLQIKQCLLKNFHYSNKLNNFFRPLQGGCYLVKLFDNNQYSTSIITADNLKQFDNNRFNTKIINIKRKVI